MLRLGNIGSLQEKNWKNWWKTDFILVAEGGLGGVGFAILKEGCMVDYFRCFEKY